MRTKLIKGEVQVSNQVYTTVVKLGQQRALASASHPDEHAILGCIFDVMKDEIIDSLKAKVKGKSRAEAAELLLTDRAKQKLGERIRKLSLTNTVLDQEEIDFTFDKLEEIIPDLEKNDSDSKSKVKQTLKDLRKHHAERMVLSLWTTEHQRQLQDQLKKDRELVELLKMAHFATDKEDATKQEELIHTKFSELWTQIIQEQGSSKTTVNLDHELMTDQAKDLFERNQADQGVGEYASEFEYTNYSDKVSHSLRIKQRQEELLARVPDPMADPEGYRSWLLKIRLADVAATKLAQAMDDWAQAKLSDGYNPMSEDAYTRSIPNHPVLENLSFKKRPALSKLWDVIARKYEKKEIGTVDKTLVDALPGE